MVGRLGEEVCVAVRRMCSVSGVLATPVVPTNVPSNIHLKVSGKCEREKERGKREGEGREREREERESRSV